jgi:hypothetical protein
MKKQLFITGIVLIIIGIVFIPIAILTPTKRTYTTEEFEAVLRYDRTPVPYSIEVSLQGVTKYRLSIGRQDLTGSSSPKVEIKNPSGNTIYLSTKADFYHTFYTQSSGVYTIEILGYIEEGERIDSLLLSKVTEKTEAYYVESPFSYVAVLLIIAGVGISISSKVFFR